MQEYVPLFVLLALFVFAVIFGLLYFQQNARLMGSEERQQQQLYEKLHAAQLEVKAKQQENQDYQRQLDAQVTPLLEAHQAYNLDATTMTITDLNARYLYRERDSAMRLAECARGGGEVQEGAREKIRKLKEKTEADIAGATTRDHEEKEKLLDSLRAREGELERARRQEETGIKDEENRHRKDMSSLRSQEVDQQDVLKTLASRPERWAKFDADGEVLFSDPALDLVMINLGRADGVQPGWRFEVYSLQKGLKRQRKCFIEVQKAYETTSMCAPYRIEQKLPADPLSDYVAEDPEEQFSPYAGKGQAGNEAQPLTGTPVRTSTGPRFDNPILAGDLLMNPFYEKGQPRRWVIAGDEPIHYRPEHLKKIIERYGGIVVDEIAPAVDYALTQRWKSDASQSSAYEEITTLGIQIVPEFTVFRFLEDR